MLLFVNEDVAQVHEFGLGVFGFHLDPLCPGAFGAVTIHSLGMLSVEARGNQVAPSVEVETSIFFMRSSLPLRLVMMSPARFTPFFSSTMTFGLVSLSVWWEPPQGRSRLMWSHGLSHWQVVEHLTMPSAGTSFQPWGTGVLTVLEEVLASEKEAAALLRVWKAGMERATSVA